MAKFDIETYLLAIETYMKANLNTYIGNLNTEKNDSITLSTVSNDAYFLQTLNDRVANFDPYILLAIDDIQGQGIGPGVVKTLVFTAVIVVADQSMDLLIGRRMLRYGRVLEDLFNDGFGKIIQGATFKINSLVPIAITSVNSNDPFRAIGVEIVSQLG